MPSTEEVRRIAIALVVLISTGCSATLQPSPTASSPTPTARTEEPIESTSGPTESPSASPSTAAINLPQPGRPFDATTLLAAMRASRRPGGVPDQVETDAIAAALADAIWTFDGQPWTTTAAGGSCGPNSCTLEIAGSRTDPPGEDLWVFAVTPATSSVEVVSSELRSLPADLGLRLDQLTRTIVRAGSLDGALMTSVRWLPPPDHGRFVLNYRSGGEEGSCRIDYTLDAGGASIVSEQAANC